MVKEKSKEYKRGYGAGYTAGKNSNNVKVEQAHNTLRVYKEMFDKVAGVDRPEQFERVYMECLQLVMSMPKEVWDFSTEDGRLERFCNLATTLAEEAIQHMDNLSPQ